MNTPLGVLAFALLSTSFFASFLAAVVPPSNPASLSKESEAAKFFEQKDPVVKKSYVYAEHEYLKENPSAKSIPYELLRTLVAKINEGEDLTIVNEAVKIIDEKVKVLMTMFVGVEERTLLYIAADALKYKSLMKYVQEHPKATEAEVEANLTKILKTRNDRLFCEYQAFTPEVMKNLLKSFKIFLKKTNTEPHLTDNEITITIGTEQKLDPAKYGKEKKLTFAAEVPPEDLNQSSSSSKTNSFIFYLFVGISLWIVLAAIAYFLMQRMRKPADSIPYFDSEKAEEKNGAALDKKLKHKLAK